MLLILTVDFLLPCYVLHIGSGLSPFYYPPRIAHWVLGCRRFVPFSQFHRTIRPELEDESISDNPGAPNDTLLIWIVLSE